MNSGMEPSLKLVSTQLIHFKDVHSELILADARSNLIF